MVGRRVQVFAGSPSQKSPRLLLCQPSLELRLQCLERCPFAVVMVPKRLIEADDPDAATLRGNQDRQRIDFLGPGEGAVEPDFGLGPAPGPLSALGPVQDGTIRGSNP